MADDAPAQTFVFYRYNPSMGGAIVMSIVFFAISIFQIVKMFRQRTWYFIPFIIGCLFEAIGYVGRDMSATEAPNFTKNPYIIQSILLLLGPTLMAASIYMVLGRIIIVTHGEQYSIIKPKWLTKFFVLGDVLSFFAQGGGGGMLVQATTEDDVNRGNNIIVGGLGIQILFFGFFVIVALVFNLRLRSRPTTQVRTLTTPWQGLLMVLYASSCCIMIRSIYRVAEYVGGSDSVLMTKELYLYVLDALPMSITGLLFCWFHPSRVVSAEALGQARLNSGMTMEDMDMDSRTKMTV